MPQRLVVIALCLSVAGCKSHKGAADAGTPNSNTSGYQNPGGTGIPAPVNGSACKATTPAAAGDCLMKASAGLPAARVSGMGAVAADRFLIVGGQSADTSFPGNVLGTVIGSDGKPGAWTTSAIPVTHPHQAVAVVGGDLYLFGGEVVGTLNGSADVFSGAIGDQGAVTFHPAKLLPEARTYLAAAASADHIYLVGGGPTTIDQDAKVYVVSLASDGTISGYRPGPPLPEPRGRAGAVVVNGYLYVAGGEFAGASDSCAKDQVLYAKVNADGSLGAWTATTSLGAQPTGAVLVASGAHLYLVGGTAAYGDKSQGDDVGSVLEADIHADGSLGVWQRVGYLPDQRFNHSVGVVAGKLLVFGGLVMNPTPDIALSDGLMATIQADGTLSCQ